MEDCSQCGCGGRSVRAQRNVELSTRDDLLNRTDRLHHYCLLHIYTRAASERGEQRIYIHRAGTNRSYRRMESLVGPAIPRRGDSGPPAGYAQARGDRTVRCIYNMRPRPGRSSRSAINPHIFNQLIYIYVKCIW